MEQKIQEWQLKQRQALPLEVKIERTKLRIREFYEHYDGMVYVAFSGGKDSTVLLNLVRDMYPEVLAVFIDTGLEFPEIREHVKTIDNVTWVKPKMKHPKVLTKYGFPVISKEVSMAISRYRNTTDPFQKEYRLHGTKNGVKIGVRGVIPKKWHFLIDAPFKISEQCCDVMKKAPAHKYDKVSGRKPFIGTMASNSNAREMFYQAHGCNIFEGHAQSNPLGFWLEKDIWSFIGKYDIPYSRIYDMGYERTGCIFCMFGCHMENPPNRFQLLARTHPKLYNYCINKLGLKEVLEYIGVDYKPLTTLDDFTE